VVSAVPDNGESCVSTDQRLSRWKVLFPSAEVDAESQSNRQAGLRS
jgi:hypothetical protein